MQCDRKRTFLLFIILFSSLPFLFQGCRKDATPVEIPNPQITITAEAGVIEAWLTVTTEEADGMEVVLTRDGIERLRFPLRQAQGSAAVTDTTVVDTGLLPSHSYTFAARLVKDKQITAHSKSVQLTTMDTTSHNFTWEIYEFGGVHGSSVLYDVAIVNENDIWAVGEIHTAETDTFDSTGNWVPPYNAVHWDGSGWELKRFMYLVNGIERIIIPVRGIWHIKDNDIWLAAGSVYHWDGNIAKMSYQRDINTFQTVEKLWAASPSNIYGVGNQGLIVQYNGQRWTRLRSGTELGLTDIWGRSENEIYTVGLHYGQVLGVVLKYNCQYWEKMIEGAVPGSGFDPDELFKTQLYGTTEGVWVDEKGTVYTVGNLMYQYKLGKWDYVRSLPENFIGGDPNNTYRGYLHAIRGNAANDIFIFGESNTIIHFNGMTWKRIGPPYVPWSYHFWYGCDVKGDLIIGVGKTSGQLFPKAWIIKIWR